MADSPEINHISDTALWVATYRAQESARPDALFRDPLAAVLTEGRGRELARAMGNSAIMSWIMVVRTVAIDQLILEAIAQGFDTVLNLGAGLDTRPYRMKLPSDLRWIEVDFPGMIDFKSEKLKAEKPVCRLERVALDLSVRDARREFFGKIGRESKKVLVLTEGVILYLAAEEAAELADDLAAVPAFAGWIQDFHQLGNRRRLPRQWKSKLRAAPFRFYVPDLWKFFAAHGWVRDEVILAADQGRKIGRRFPMPFPWNFLVVFAPRRARENMRTAWGYARLKRG